ncbi:50S ribosomal protein L25/general stress protein Ctc [Chitinibacteraceae bacterium HSL-7]
MTFEVIAQARAEQGTGASRRLRKAGQVPGIVYGGNKDAQAVSLDHNTTYYQLKEEGFHTALINMTIDGVSEQVLLRSVQYHAFKQQVLHVDFQRVANDEQIVAKVPLHFVNAEISLGVKLQSGRVNYILNEVQVKCVAAKLPEFLEVDLSKVEKAHPGVHLSDLALPEGVELVSLARGENLAVAMLSGAKG